MAFQLPDTSGITGTGRIAVGTAVGSAYNTLGTVSAPAGNNVAGYGSSPTAGSTLLSPAIQTIWSKEILFQAMPVLRFEQFAVKKTELGVMPGLQVNFMRYNNLPIPAGPLVEGVRMRTYGISAQQYRITVAEQGFAVAISELLLNASFDDVMASASRLLGRNMAQYMDVEARQSLQSASSPVYGRRVPASITTGYGIYNSGQAATDLSTTDAGAVHGLAAPTALSGVDPFLLTPAVVKDAVLELSSKNIPRLGETYVCFIHPAQSRQIRDTPEFIEVTKYAAPGNFMLGEIGRLYDVVFIETTQIDAVPTVDPLVLETYADQSPLDWRTQDELADDGTGAATPAPPVGNAAYPISGNADVLTGTEAGAADGVRPTPGWDQRWPTSYNGPVDATVGTFEALMLGDNAFGHAISLPVELRDGGVLDFGREHALAWYAIWGFGLITDSAVVKIRTNG
jgi:N4-gp56 family major capsid protein